MYSFTTTNYTVQTRAATNAAAVAAKAAEAKKTSSSDVTSPADGTSFIPMTTVSSDNTPSSNEKEGLAKRRTRSTAKAEAEAAETKKRRLSYAATGMSSPASVPADDHSFIPMTTVSSHNTPPSNEEEGLGFVASLFANMKQGSPNRPVEQPSLPKPVDPGTLSHSDYGFRELEKPRRHSERVKQELEKRNAKSIQEALENHDALNVNLSVRSIQPAMEELGLGEHGRLASRVIKGYEEKMAAVLKAGSKNALPQQNSNLSGKQVARKNYRAAYNGRSGAHAGFNVGELGRTTNGRGERVDAARSKAMAAMMPGSEFEKHNAKKALNAHSVIAQLVRNQGTEGSIPADCITLINENNHSMNHRDLSENAFKDLVDGARGCEVKDTSSLDAIMTHFWPVKTRDAGNDKKKWNKLRMAFIMSFTAASAAMRFKVERFDDNGVLTKEVGANNKRRQLAKYRFKIIEDDKRFEYEVTAAASARPSEGPPKRKSTSAMPKEDAKKGPPKRKSASAMPKEDAKKARLKRKSTYNESSDSDICDIKPRRKSNGKHYMDMNASEDENEDWDA